MFFAQKMLVKIYNTRLALYQNVYFELNGILIDSTVLKYWSSGFPLAPYFHLYLQAHL